MGYRARHRASVAQRDRALDAASGEAPRFRGRYQLARTSAQAEPSRIRSALGGGPSRQRGCTGAVAAGPSGVVFFSDADHEAPGAERYVGCCSSSAAQKRDGSAGVREMIRLPSTTTPGHPVGSGVSLEVDAAPQPDDSGL